MADRHDTAAMVQQKPEFCRNMTGDSNLKISVGEAEPEQVSSSFIVTEQHSSQPGIFVKLQQPCTHGIQSVDTFTVDNYFGFDEESEDDLRLSLSPVKMATSLKPVVSVPFAVSSTPNLKPSFTRPHAKPFRLVNKGPKTETTLMSKPAVSEMPVASDAVRGAHNSSTSVLFMDENVPMQHFVKRPRRSYERAGRLCRQSRCEGEALSESKECNKTRAKRSKKAKIKEERTIKKWVANVRAQFSEIESFELCVE